MQRGGSRPLARPLPLPTQPTGCRSRITVLGEDQMGGPRGTAMAITRLRSPCSTRGAPSCHFYLLRLRQLLISYFDSIRVRNVQPTNPKRQLCFLDLGKSKSLGSHDSSGDVGEFGDWSKARKLRIQPSLLSGANSSSETVSSLSSFPLSVAITQRTSCCRSFGFPTHRPWTAVLYSWANQATYWA